MAFDGHVTRVYVWDPTLRTGVVALTIIGRPERAGWGQWRVRTTDGLSFLLRDDGTCGCSHPLKTWQLPKPHKVSA